MAEKIILKNDLCPGDILMLTAAVRDLHRTHPGRFVTDLRTPCPALWENNPYVESFPPNDTGIRTVQCHYPSINRSNQEPYHFIHGFHRYLSRKLEVEFSPTDFKGDIHLSSDEKDWVSQVHEVLQREVPFWIIVAGGKFDYTIKWWDHKRYQKVVNHFLGRLAFVQIGSSDEHHHPALDNVIDLRGKTDLRQLVRLMYHANGVICPVTMAMHLAAAVDLKRPFYPTQNRPCVVVAGGREPPHWEAYPYHQYLHTVGMLPCCESGGCWRARVKPLGDGDEKDLQRNICLNVTNKELPQCMDMITEFDVIRAVEKYIQGGAVRLLSDADREAIEQYHDSHPRDD